MFKKQVQIPLKEYKAYTGKIDYFTETAGRCNDMKGLLEKYVAEKMPDPGVEHFCILGLGHENKILGIEMLSVGSDHEARVFPNDIIESAREMEALALILFHNHPKDTAKPSQIDIETTKIVTDLARDLGIDVLDHYIKGIDGTISMRAEGYIEEQLDSDPCIIY